MSTANPVHAPTPAKPFASRLAAAMDRTGSIACVGLDPVIEKLPAPLQGKGEPHTAINDFSLGVLDSIAGLVPAVKFQSACYERHGPRAIEHLHALIAHARSIGLIAILDAKRGDIGISAEHYAHAAFGPPPCAGADALTVNPYMGVDTLEPYLAEFPNAGLFVLVRTSNPGSDLFQSQALASGQSVAESVGRAVAEFGRKFISEKGLSSIGAVVGATKAADAASLRAAMPDQCFLVPGFGAQGGTAADIRPMLRPGSTPGSRGTLVTASRSVIYPKSNDGSWSGSVRKATEVLNAELAQVLN